MGGVALGAGDDVLQVQDLIEHVMDLVAGGEVGGANCRARIVGLGDDLGSAA